MHEPGPLIAQGRAADVFDYGERFVLRRYRSDHFLLYEAAVMQYVASHGYPVPEVTEIQGRDMVMQRVDGPTMLTDLGSRPWMIRKHANTLARLALQLHEIPQAPWLDPRVGGGPVIVHMDLHPDNVLITKGGPVVIDWSNAGAGEVGAEIADLWLLMSIAEVPGEGLKPKLLSAGRKFFLNTFLKHFDLDEARKHLRAAGDWRLRDRNMLDGERERIKAFVAANAT